MKTKIFTPLLILLFTGLSCNLAAQNKFTYRLNGTFDAVESGAPTLVQIPNNDGYTGMFVARSIPETTCELGGTADGYFFEDDAGLQFDNPAGFIDAGVYSLSMIFHFDEFIDPPPWVRILSFTHDDDYGIYIYLANPPYTGTLDFWPHGTVGTENFFNTEDYYQLILVRDNEGLVTVYINGVEFASYDDSETQEYIPQPDKNYLIFFRDHPSVLADEASPGFVSNIVITKNSWNSSEVQLIWEDFCPSLFGTTDIIKKELKVYPNPVENQLTIELPANQPTAKYSIYDITGKLIIQSSTNQTKTKVDVSTLYTGMYLLKLEVGSESLMTKFTKQ